MKRDAYILTTNKESERAKFSENVLKKIGFHVHVTQHIPNECKILSIKLSMISIYNKILESGVDYAYVFEDDINAHEEIHLDEIIQYESISPMFFHLGVATYNDIQIKNTNIQINSHDVISVSKHIRGLHAIGISKKGIETFLHFIKQSEFYHLDEILEEFAGYYPANVARYDLQSYIPGHRGIIFQDRKQFPSGLYNYEMNYTY